jgi:hypothetical protein
MPVGAPDIAGNEPVPANTWAYGSRRMAPFERLPRYVDPTSMDGLAYTAWSAGCPMGNCGNGNVVGDIWPHTGSLLGRGALWNVGLGILAGAFGFKLAIPAVVYAGLEWSQMGKPISAAVETKPGEAAPLIERTPPFTAGHMAGALGIFAAGWWLGTSMIAKKKPKIW